MTIVAPDGWVVAEMITHDYIWRGAGATCDEAREALLTAWTRHRDDVLRQQPSLAERLPVAPEMPRHFPIRYQAYERGAGYRDQQRLV